MEAQNEQIKGAIYLIDDDPGGIMSIVRSIFPEMWNVEKDEGIETHIGIFGNAAYGDSGELSLMDSDDEKDFIRAVEDELWYLCNEYDEKNGTVNTDPEICVTYEKKQRLIEDNIHLVYKSDVDNAMDTFKNILMAWSANSAGDEDIDPDGNVSYKVKETAKKLAESTIADMKIPDKACVGLDLALLQGDIDKVRLDNQPIISMELYNNLQQKHDCFLYSKYVMDESFIDGWKEVYKKYYESEDDVKIYQKNQLYKKEISKELMEKLIKMAKY